MAERGRHYIINFGALEDVREPVRAALLMAMGFLSAMHTMVIVVGPEPISPPLLYHAIDGRDAFNIDPKFLKLIDPDALSILQPWLSWDGKIDDLKNAESCKKLRELLEGAEVPVRYHWFTALCFEWVSHLLPNHYS